MLSILGWNLNPGANLQLRKLGLGLGKLSKNGEASSFQEGKGYWET